MLKAPGPRRRLSSSSRATATAKRSFPQRTKAGGVGVAGIVADTLKLVVALQVGVAKGTGQGLANRVGRWRMRGQLPRRGIALLKARGRGMAEGTRQTSRLRMAEACCTKAFKRPDASSTKQAQRALQSSPGNLPGLWQLG